MSANDELAGQSDDDDVIYSDRVVSAAHLAAVTVRPESCGDAEYWRIRGAVCWALHHAMLDERWTEISQSATPPRPTGIPWVPIADMAEEWKDGREVLVWDVEHGAIVAEWLEKLMGETPGWFDVIGFNRLDPTAFCEINPPGGL